MSRRDFKADKLIPRKEFISYPIDKFSPIDEFQKAQRGYFNGPEGDEDCGAHSTCASLFPNEGETLDCVDAMKRHERIFYRREELGDSEEF